MIRLTRHISATIAAAALLLAAPQLTAQRAQAFRLHPSPSVVFGADLRVEPKVAPSNTDQGHWKSGAVVGAVVLGAAGAVIENGLCEANESCTRPTIGGLLLGGLVGGVIGAFIGDAIR